MIKIIRKGEDIVDCITGDIEKIKNVVYFTHCMSSSNGITPIQNVVDGVLECRLSSQSLLNLTKGQLICEVELEESDSKFPDNKYNEIVRTTFPIWINN